MKSFGVDTVEVDVEAGWKYKAVDSVSVNNCGPYMSMCTMAPWKVVIESGTGPKN